MAAATEALCGFEVSSAQVSRAAQLLDDELEAWRNQLLSEIPYLLLDARNEKVRYFDRDRAKLGHPQISSP